jgi:hypothetical protein
MQFSEIKNEAVQILTDANGRFMSAYQICQHLKKDYRAVWNDLAATYPSNDADRPMGEGAGMKYSPATFVAKALGHFVKNGSVQGLHQEYFSCEGVEFSGISPGYTGNVIGIWAIKNS